MSKSLVLVNVRFLDQVQPTTCIVDDLKIHYGQKVVVLSDRGLAVGIVNSLPFYPNVESGNQNYRNILKIATNQDIDDCKIIYQEQRRAGDIFKRLVAQHGLDMNLEQFKYTSNGRKVIFYYRSKDRIDFKNLLKSLKKEIPVSIELHQLSPNENRLLFDKIGPCGMELCLFINSTIQDVNSNIPRCSESKCCLEFNDPFYEDKFSRLPKKGDYIQTKTMEIGRVVKLDPVREEFELLTDMGVLKRYISEMYDKKLNKNSIFFPDSFERISNETKNVIRRTE
jgi:cell fate regulator YaaT (PSP1 superfamily)